MTVPADRKYTASHEWVKVEADGTVIVGISDFAQDALGDIVFVDLPKVGQVLVAGKDCCVIESVKAAGDVYAPVAGTVTAVNDAVVDAPDTINANAFDAWLFKMLSPEDYIKNIG
jgi:glycine cleavage system H protein